MITLLVLAAIVLTPMALLLLTGPGDLELMTQPKHLGVFEAEIRSNRPYVKSVDTDGILTGIHASSIPAGMRGVLVES